MSLLSLFKQSAISCGLYGPLKRIRRRLLRPQEQAQFEVDQSFYSSFLSPGDLCFDIGSNIGEKAEVFLSIGAKVVAFEPQPKCFREMKARCSPNSGLTAVNEALGAEPGVCSMYVSEQKGASSLVPGWSRSIREVIPVKVGTLDEAIHKYGQPKFCKIDVEGFELQVLKGLSSVIPCISIEYHHNDADIIKVLSCVDLLSKFGELNMNVTFGESPGFVWNEWVRYETFRDYFPARVPRTDNCGYGDLFIKICPR